MTPAELVSLFRREVDDRESPYLWTDDMVYHYLDTAQKTFAQETRCFSDATSADTCSVTVIAAEKFVDLSPLIVEIRRAKLLSQSRTMRITSLDKIDEALSTNDYGISGGSASWDALTGTPRLLVTNIEQDKGRLIPIPTVADTLELMVYRLPLNDITSASTELEILDVRFQRYLLMGMKALAYDTHDSDLRNEELAVAYSNKFYGACKEVKWELGRKRDKNWTTRCAWI